MVVAGRVTETGDVAIMMVEAEATEQTWDLVQSGAQAPTEEIVAGGLDAAKPFIKQLCEAQAELAKPRPPSRSRSSRSSSTTRTTSTPPSRPPPRPTPPPR